MSDESSTIHARRCLKSCIKYTPPITPELSAAPSPCDSGRTSPSLVSDSGSSVSSGGRKTVAWCSDDELEEVFYADEWDRTPSAVTPKLSYQCVFPFSPLSRRRSLRFCSSRVSCMQGRATSAPFRCAVFMRSLRGARHA